jgi:hypothetical protein
MYGHFRMSFQIKTTANIFELTGDGSGITVVDLLPWRNFLQPIKSGQYVPSIKTLSDHVESALSRNKITFTQSLQAIRDIFKFRCSLLECVYTLLIEQAMKLNIKSTCSCPGCNAPVFAGFMASDSVGDVVLCRCVF